MKKMELKRRQRPHLNQLLLSVKGDCSIYHISQLQEVLIKDIKLHETVKLDFSETTSVDLAAIQLIYSASRYARSNGKTLEIEGTLPAFFSEMTKQSGLDVLDLIGNLNNQ